MSNILYKYIPVRRGTTGVEYLPQWLDEYYPNVSFDGVVSDGLANFGVLSGSGDEFSKAMSAIEGRFSGCRLDTETFIGVCDKHYDETQQDQEGNPVPSLTAMLASHGITMTGTVLDARKLAKIALFKELLNKKLETTQDCLSDVAKSTVLLVLWYDELSTEEKATVDSKISTLKSIYTKQMCIDGFDKMVSNVLDAVVSGYYTAKNNVNSAADSTAVDAVTFE